MKRKILFSGIDGTGKTTCLYALLDRMDPRYRILKVGFSGTFLIHGGKRERLVSQRRQDRIESIGERARKAGLYGIFLIFNFIYKYLMSKYFQVFRRADLVMFETDTLLHPVVYITHHFSAAGRISPAWRFRLVSSVFGGRRGTLIFYLEADPAVSVERVQRREIEEGTPVEPHENLKDLTVLKAEFERVVAAAEAQGYRVARIDTTHKSAEAVVDEVEVALRDFLREDGCPTPGPADLPA